jgi:glycosyltransferase involved in cell wall biosynthesis
VSKSVIKNQTWGGVLSVDPFVTISKRADFFEQPMGFALVVPDLARRGRSVHFVGLCDTLEKPEEADAVARDHRALAKQYGDALFIFIVSSEIECLNLSLRGVPSFLANELIFVDDTRFKIVREMPEPQYDAIYNAQFYPFKRHQLTQDIEKLLLIYKMSAEDSLEQLRRRFPAATFANNLDGAYRRFTPEELSVWYGRSAVGLCLSPSEGAMRVSMEYQLCGLPVVTTPSIGGRDRYFIDDHIRFCPPDQKAVADAVSAFRKQPVDPQLIRNRVLRLLAFDRFNFLRAANKVVAQHCGARQLFRNFAPFRGTPIQPQMLSRVLASAGGKAN